MFSLHSENVRLRCKQQQEKKDKLQHYFKTAVFQYTEARDIRATAHKFKVRESLAYLELFDK